MSLTDREARQAARYNRRSAGRIGWRQHYRRIAVLLGLDRRSVSEEQFARVVDRWQAAQRPPLETDGKIGPTTWRRFQREIDNRVRSSPNIPMPTWLGGGAGGAGPQIIAPAEAIGTGPRWLQIARAEERRWATEISGWGPGRNRAHPETELNWDEAYFATSPRWGETTHRLGQTQNVENRDWCAAFVNYCLHRAGFSHTGSAGANSFLKSTLWHFNAEKKPREGCVVVVGDARTGRGAHVAFLDKGWNKLPFEPDGHVQNTSDRVFILLGGNQSDRVISRQEPVRVRRDMLAARGQNGVTSPYLWPLQGPQNCNIGSLIPTEQRHHCHYVPSAGS